MSTWETLAALGVAIDGYELSGNELEVSAEMTRVTTTITLAGGGQQGVGEDVVYEPLDQYAFGDQPRIDLGAATTLAELSDLLDGADLFERVPPEREVSRLYRRWAFESAALDLALRQAGESLAGAVGRPLEPLHYVVSMRLTSPGPGEPETADRLVDVLARYPGTRFKLDPTNTWTDELIETLAATGAVAAVDLKGHYSGTPVDVETDPDLYRRVAQAFPDAWLEDPDLSDPAAAEALADYRDRITWDAPIHSIEDIEALPFKPRMVNIKPSRIGGLRAVCDAYDYCAAHGIGAYGGGQTELGAGRDHIQYLAALFHPDTPNDTAPRGFNETPVPDGLPPSPMTVPAAATGFRFA